jgi:cyclopropane-fatty-acyl-phospholipid synthase
MLAARLVDWLIVDQGFVLRDARGVDHRCGPINGQPDLVLRLTRDIPSWRFIAQPSLTLGEAYMRGDLIIERGSLRQVMALVFREIERFNRRHPRLAVVRAATARLMGRLRELNSRTSSRANIAHHYDLDAEIFELLLDRHMQYTCAAFPDAALPCATEDGLACYETDQPLDLDAAQDRRIDQIIGKLRIERGMRVLDVGCGWGGLAIEIARRTGASVTGITISAQQLAFAREKAVASGLAGAVTFEHCDYRDIASKFDRIVAAGILEHIGKPQFNLFLARLTGALRVDGLLLIDALGRVDAPAGTNAWLRKYIFPGGYIPALSEITAAAETERCFVYDIDVSTLQYALTVREWTRRLAANAGEIEKRRGIDFVRMLEVYLATSEMSLLHGRFINFQLLAGNSRFAVPLNRGGMTDAPARRAPAPA